MSEQKKTLRPTPTAILNPRLDVNFKALFTQGTRGSYIALQSFLSSVLGRKIKSLALAPNEPAVETTSNMQMAFDIAVTFDDGEQADIEVQGREYDYDYSVRAEIYAARMLNNSAKKGDNYNNKKDEDASKDGGDKEKKAKKIPKVYQISVFNFHFKKGDKSEMLWYTMRDQHGGELAGRLNVIFIDLLTIRKLVGTPAQKLTPLQKWGLFLSYADDESKRDYVNKIAQSEEGIMEAEIIAQTMSEEEANWWRQNSRQKFWEDYYADRAAAVEKGIEQGMQQGAQQKAIENAKTMLADNLSPEKISQYSGLPLDQVRELAEQLAAQPATAQA